MTDAGVFLSKKLYQVSYVAYQYYYLQEHIALILFWAMCNFT